MFAQKQLTIEQCETFFLKNNFLLIAEQYNIVASQAGVVQAAIWEQPYFNAEFNFVNPEAGAVFDVGKNGQKAFAIQQLIYLGGKKKSEIALARSNQAIAEMEFEQLVRQLKFEIATSFYTLFFEINKASSIEEQLQNVDRLTDAYAEQVKRGNIALKDLVRLQSLSLNIKSQLSAIRQNIFQAQSNLKLLTGLDSLIVPAGGEQISDEDFVKVLSYNSDQIKERAIGKNTEILIAEKMVANAELYLQWQKTLNTPDLTLGPSYDQRGGAFANQVNMNLGISLPFWRRNRGNISIAKAQSIQSSVLKDHKTLELKTKIDNTINNLLHQQQLYKNFGPEILPNAELVYRGMLANFQKQNISLIEFTDFIESYSQSILLINEIKKQIVLFGEELNFLVNEKLF
ncbi:TolC family protein [Pollutibacter soli]|uniref:TolC family protein n=1 Tax=Pollutibacter soli TaxID=3034157 RepID=UPI003013D900